MKDANITISSSRQKQNDKMGETENDDIGSFTRSLFRYLLEYSLVAESHSKSVYTKMHCDLQKPLYVLKKKWYMPETISLGDPYCKHNRFSESIVSAQTDPHDMSIEVIYTISVHLLILLIFIAKTFSLQITSFNIFVYVRSLTLHHHCLLKQTERIHMDN